MRRALLLFLLPALMASGECCPEDGAPPPAERCTPVVPGTDLPCAPGTCYYPSEGVCR